ncbi:MAG TPA: DUF6624 domain-containing protein [Steroidobacteraceae bacterium]|nr:DUF6624 domain-containing protein [Steroidobacteraceae bacterium]
MNARVCIATLLSLVIAFASGTSCCFAAEAQADVKGKLTEMGIADQAIRKKLGPFLVSGKFQTEEFKDVAKEMAAIDARNLAELKQIINLHGWPDARIVGVDAGNSAFLILQHSPLTAQKEYLPMFREAVSAGKARGVDLAMLEDRILNGDGKPQRFGTQVSAGPDGKPRVNPVEDPKNLDSRRKALGMPPIKEYLDRLEADIGRSIDRSALTD